jgi:hypothetical protein
VEQQEQEKKAAPQGPRTGRGGDPAARPRVTRLEDVGRRMDEEIEELIRWLNDDVVPAVRSRSSRTLRKAAEKLAGFADYMDQQKPQR